MSFRDEEPEDREVEREVDFDEEDLELDDVFRESSFLESESRRSNRLRQSELRLLLEDRDELEELFLPFSIRPFPPERAT